MNIANSTNSIDTIIRLKKEDIQGGKPSHFLLESIDEDRSVYIQGGVFSNTKNLTLSEYKELEKKDTGSITSNETMEMTKFHGTEEYAAYHKTQLLEQGNKKDIKTIITIGEDKLSISYDGSIQTPNSYAHYISRANGADVQGTLENLYAEFGKSNVIEETFLEEKGPTNAEYFEEKTGKNYYRFVMSDGRI
jgi:hypothetical protein